MLDAFGIRKVAAVILLLGCALCGQAQSDREKWIEEREAACTKLKCSEAQRCGLRSGMCMPKDAVDCGNKRYCTPGFACVKKTASCAPVRPNSEGYDTWNEVNFGAHGILILTRESGGKRLSFFLLARAGLQSEHWAGMVGKMRIVTASPGSIVPDRIVGVLARCLTEEISVGPPDVVYTDEKLGWFNEPEFPTLEEIRRLTCDEL